jgi:hypothetical protein
MRSITFVENGPACIMAVFTLSSAILVNRQMKGLCSFVRFLLVCLISINIHNMVWHIHEGPYVIPGIEWLDSRLLGSYLILALHIHPFLVLSHLSAKYPHIQVFLTLVLSFLYNECVWAVQTRDTNAESNRVDAHLIWAWKASILDVIRICLQTALVLVTASSIVRNKTGVYLFSGIVAMQLILAVTLHIRVGGNGHHLTLYVYTLSVCVEIVCFYMLLSQVSYHLHDINHCRACDTCKETACIDCVDCVDCGASVHITAWREHVFEYTVIVELE